MDQRELIRRAYFIDGKSIRCIAREGHHDRRTVRKFLGDAGPPSYTLKVPRRRPVLDPFRAVIDQWLKRTRTGLPSNVIPPTASTTAWCQSLPFKAESPPSENTLGRSGQDDK